METIDRIEELYAQAIGLFDQGRFDEAADMFSRALIHAKSASALGGLLRNRAQAYEKAFESSPGEIGYLFCAAADYSTLVDQGPESGFHEDDIAAAAKAIISVDAKIRSLVDNAGGGVAESGQVDAQALHRWQLRWEGLSSIHSQMKRCAIGTTPLGASRFVLSEMERAELNMLANSSELRRKDAREVRKALVAEAREISYSSPQVSMAEDWLDDDAALGRNLGLGISGGLAVVGGAIAIQQGARFVPRAEASLMGANLSEMRREELIAPERAKGRAWMAVGGVVVAAGVSLAVASIVLHVRRTPRRAGSRAGGSL